MKQQIDDITDYLETPEGIEKLQRLAMEDMEWEAQQERMMDVWDKENTNRFSQKNCPNEWKQQE